MTSQDHTKDTIKVYRTDNHPCSYLDQEAATQFIDPEHDIGDNLLSHLIQKGFWRSGPYVFKPDCLQCSSCLPIRIPVQDYLFSKNNRRTIKALDAITITETKDINIDALYPLYERYINERHPEGDMFPPSKAQFQNFLTLASKRAKLVLFHQQETLVMVALMEETTDAYLALYTFYEPHYKPISLGHAAILWQILYSQVHQKTYLYLGYWIKNCQKMRYKSRYQPAEVRLGEKWVPLI